jgi:hypothetical protein
MNHNFIVGTTSGVDPIWRPAQQLIRARGNPCCLIFAETPQKIHVAGQGWVAAASRMRPYLCLEMPQYIAGGESVLTLSGRKIEVEDFGRFWLRAHSNSTGLTPHNNSGEQKPQPHWGGSLKVRVNGCRPIRFVFLQAALKLTTKICWKEQTKVLSSYLMLTLQCDICSWHSCLCPCLSPPRSTTRSCRTKLTRVSSLNKQNSIKATEGQISTALSLNPVKFTMKSGTD